MNLNFMLALKDTFSLQLCSRRFFEWVSFMPIYRYLHFGSCTYRSLRSSQSMILDQTKQYSGIDLVSVARHGSRTIKLP